jgi:hypothetical protein
LERIISAAPKTWEGSVTRPLLRALDTHAPRGPQDRTKHKNGKKRRRITMSTSIFELDATNGSFLCFDFIMPPRTYHSLLPYHPSFPQRHSVCSSSSLFLRHHQAHILRTYKSASNSPHSRAGLHPFLNPIEINLRSIPHIPELASPFFLKPTYLVNNFLQFQLGRSRN